MEMKEEHSSMKQVPPKRLTPEMTILATQENTTGCKSSSGGPQGKSRTFSAPGGDENIK